MEKDSKRKYVVDKKINNDNCSVHFSIKITFQMKHLMKKTFSQALQNKEVLHFFLKWLVGMGWCPAMWQIKLLPPGNKRLIHGRGVKTYDRGDRWKRE